MQPHAPAPAPSASPPASRDLPGERPFWGRAGAAWRQLAGGFRDTGFSFEWHELRPDASVVWADSFHQDSVEICLNLQGTGWVANGTGRLELIPGTAGFFACKGARLTGQRTGGERHEFLSVEFSLAFLQTRLKEHGRDLHPVLKRCLGRSRQATAVSEVSALNNRRRELLKSLLQPPVMKSAQRLWYESKALEFAAEFFFSGDGPELLCTRAQKLASERVARAKALLLASLTEPPSLEELGRQVACSPFYLSRTFTQETGLTLSQYLRQVRLEKAAELLRTGRCNVTEAALSVGYSSLSHFSQAFHEVFGCCPGLYPLRTPTQDYDPKQP